MRILIVNKFAHVTGGADRHCLTLAHALRERGHEVAFLSTASPRNLETVGRFVECSVTAESRDGLSAARRAAAAARALWNPEAAAAMSALLRGFRPHVVHTHKLYPQLSVAPVVVAARHGVPVVHTLHDYELVAANPLDDSGRSIDRIESRRAYRTLNSLTYAVRKRVHAPRVAAWATCSRFVADVHGRRGIHTTVIPNFVDVNGAAPRSFEQRAGVVFAGRLLETKGVRDVLELARRVPSLGVSIAGSGPLEPVVRSAAAELPNLSYLGVLSPESLQGLVGAARVAVVPSRWEEPGPLVALEAMAVGTPVVAYQRGGLAEYVTDANAGRIVGERPDLLARACADLHGDRADWCRLSVNGRRAVETIHSADAHVERLVAVYEQAVKS
jgi:glycosyltransferase involved in cell wall biosynthesis